MKILVFSDTHGKTDKMCEIISKRRASADLVLHLGDCFSDIAEIRNDFPDIAFLGVSGNCDYRFSEDYPQSNAVSLEGHTLFFTHGHLYQVQSSLTSLTFAASSKGADIALFGHTHIGLCTEVPFPFSTDGDDRKILICNPGSLSRPRDGSGGTYGVLEISENFREFTITDVEKEQI